MRELLLYPVEIRVAKVTSMHCRSACGACCIAPSISQPFYGMPNGKPAGVVCAHLGATMNCQLFGDKRRPALCEAFAAERSVCGDSREQAIAILEEMELLSLPEVMVPRG